MNFRFFGFIFLFVVAGCSSWLGRQTDSGPSRLLTANGWQMSAPNCVGINELNSGIGSGNIGRFYCTANASAKNPTNTAMAALMLESGFAAIRDECNDYFAGEAQDQTKIIFGRDVTVLLTGIATSVLSLHNASKNTLANVAFGGTLVTAGVDVYTQNYLFGVENIESVRDLTTRALAEHQNAWRGQGPFDFSSASSAIIDDEDICSPRSIARLAKEAIANGTIKPYISASGNAATGNPSTSSEEDRKDSGLMLEAGRYVGLTATPDETLMLRLWWFYLGRATDPEVDIYIGQGLVNLSQSPIKADPSGGSHYIVNPNFANKTNLVNTLEKLSENRQSIYANWISNVRAVDPQPKTEASAPAVLNQTKSVSAPIVSKASHIGVSAVRSE